ncbi:MAG TPA: thiamine diphosphokinase [Candidatus Acidoferrales bacterium]|nr:thiamine diphosphokinase [Candidatus Acidoferrales bacterium]
MHYGIFAGGELHPGTAVTQVLSQFDKVIAADSGAAIAISQEIKPDIIIGDFDSIDNVTLTSLKNVKQVRFPSEKDATDTELAVDFAIHHGATKITILGGIAGDRIDHILANIFLPEQYNVPIFFVDAGSVLWFSKGPEEKITGIPGDLLSLIPLTKIEGITTTGLKYVLKNEKLYVGKSRSVSNVFLKPNAIVRWTKGHMLIIHTLAKS